MSDKKPRIEAAQASGAFLVVDCDVPAEMTLGEWRQQCAQERRAAEAPKRGRLRRVLRRAA